MKLGDHRSLSVPVIQQLSYLTLLFPKLFNEKLCEQLLSHLRKCLEEAEKKVKGSERTALVTEVKICCGIINIYHQVTKQIFSEMFSKIIQQNLGFLCYELDVLKYTFTC